MKADRSDTIKAVTAERRDVCTTSSRRDGGTLIRFHLVAELFDMPMKDGFVCSCNCDQVRVNEKLLFLNLVALQQT